jgi:hypothetical protein
LPTTNPKENPMDIKVTFKRPSLEAETEVGSWKELAGLLTDEGTTLATIFGNDMEMVIAAVNPQGSTALASGTVEAAGEAEPAKRGRKPKAIEAVAPAPIPVPAVAAPADLVIPADGGIPPFLARTAAAPSPPPPPLMPAAAAPPIAPPASPTPPSGVNGAKIVAELRKRATGTPDAGASLVAWLAGPGIGLVMPGATFDEACAVVTMTTDEKLAGLLSPLGL